MPADYDGDGITDAAVYHPSTGVWTIRTASSGFATGSTFQWGVTGDVPVPGDYDGDGIADIAVYRPASGVWFIRQSYDRQHDVRVVPVWPEHGDMPVPGDYDGDGKTDLAVFRPSNGTWYIAQSTTSYTTSVSYQLGLTGDIPVPNVTVANAIAISQADRRQPDAHGRSRRRRPGGSQRVSPVDRHVVQPPVEARTTRRSRRSSGELNGDIPVSSDYDGDGMTDLAVWRPSNGTWFIRDVEHELRLVRVVPVGSRRRRSRPWRLRRRRQERTSPSGGRRPGRGSSGCPATNYTTDVSFQWGLAGDVPVPGDYDGDGTTDLAVWRPSTGTWFIRQSSTGYATSVSFQWGSSGDITVPGDYDGDGKTDLAV